VARAQRVTTTISGRSPRRSANRPVRSDAELGLNWYLFYPGFHTQLLLPSSDSATSRACGAAERGGPPGRGAGQSWTSTNNQRPQLPSSGAHAYRASQLTRASHASCSHLAAISQSCARVHTAGQHALCILHPRHARTPRDGWQHCRAAAMPSQTPRAAPHRRASCRAITVYQPLH
jgi:hypothetical protein